MSLSRRAFVRSLGGSATLTGSIVSARGREAFEAEHWGQSGRRNGAPAPPAAGEIRISSNENPLGPGKAAIDALVGQFDQYGRYPFNSRQKDIDVVDTLAKRYSAKRENVVLGAGSGEILRNSVRAFTSPTRALVSGTPSYESPPRVAQQIGSPVKLVPLDGDLQLDFDGMVAAAAGAGLVFVCNPNNPTATVRPAKAVADLVARIRKASPDTFILIDEAYHDYVTDPAYATSIPLALETPNVVVARTFSKAYGMAGLRLGYGIGQAETIKTLAKFKMPYNASVPTVAAAIASLNNQPHIDQERVRNTEARKFTLDFFKQAGFKATDSQTNFIFVELKRPAKDFREACKQHGVMVGRDFPPFEKTHARISIGTMDEMRRATEVFRQVLGASTTTASRGR